MHINCINPMPTIHVRCTRVINDWNNLTSDIVETSSLNNFKSTIDDYFSCNNHISVSEAFKPQPKSNHNIVRSKSFIILLMDSGGCS